MFVNLSDSIQESVADFLPEYATSSRGERPYLRCSVIRLE